MPTLSKLNTFALTMLITGAIDSIRNLPSSALFGTTLIFFFVFSALVFLIPTALVSAELSAHTLRGGVYQWVRLAFGERAGFLAVWLQWVSNAVWFPTILSFIAGTAAYLIDPALAEMKVYLVCVILLVFWLLTLINLRGIRLSAKFTSFCAVAGLLIPMALIIILALIWLFLGNPIQLHFTVRSLFPNFQQSENWIALTAIMTAYCGMELSAVHIKDVENPQKTFPRALALSVIIILITMILGSLAIAFVLPLKQINLLNGTIETFSFFLSAYHLSALTPILTLLLVIGSLGGIISWIVSPIRGFSHAAEEGFLPEFLCRKNKHGVAQNLLICQAIVISLICLAFLLFPSVNGSYWLLTALSTQVYMLMYVLMFFAALRLRLKPEYSITGVFTIPGKKLGLWIVCLLGLLGCLITMGVGFIPPSRLNIGSNLYYEIIFLIGMISMIFPVIFFYYHQAKVKRKQASKIKLGSA